MPVIDFPVPIPRELMCGCWKRPKREVDLCKTGFSDEQLAESYLRKKRNPQGALEAANRQNASRALVEKHFNGKFFSRNDLNRPELEKYRLLFIGGGDNHSIWGMRYVPRETMAVVLINSDITTDPNSGSHGGILNFSAESFVNKLPQLVSGDYEVEKWPILEVEVDGEISLVGSEACFGEALIGEYSTNYIEIKDENGNVIHKGRHSGSGTLISTGAGTSNGSWLQASAFHMPSWNGAQPKDENTMFLHSMGQNLGRRGSSEIDFMAVSGSKEIHITSMNDNNGVARTDSLKTISFPEQRKAVVRVSKTPLTVIKA